MTFNIAKTKDELADEELEHAAQMEHLVGCYRSFPTADNFDLLLNKMRVYQTAWMNGRNR
jgi:hypothetical protein